jgi:hypothetical protein
MPVTLPRYSGLKCLPISSYAQIFVFSRLCMCVGRKFSEVECFCVLAVGIGWRPLLARPCNYVQEGCSCWTCPSSFEQYLVWNFLQGTIMFMKLFSHWVCFFPFPIYIPKQLHLTMPYTGPTYSVIFGGCFHWHNHLLP